MSLRKLVLVFLVSYSCLSQAGEIIAKEKICSPDEFGTNCIQLEARKKLKVRRDKKIKEERVEHGRVVTHVYYEEEKPRSTEQQQAATTAVEE